MSGLCKGGVLCLVMEMLRLILLLSVLLALPLHSQSGTVAWKSDEFGCSANLPVSQGWQPIAAPEIPGLTVLVAMQNPSRGAVFGVNVVNNAPKANLRDPLTVKTLEDALKSFQYQFFGNSFVTIGGTEWRQYNVKSIAPGQAASGVVRYGVANGRIFGVSLILGGGKEAVQDVELQTAAASVRFFMPMGAAVAVQPAEAPVVPAPAADNKVVDAKPAVSKAEEPKKEAKADEPDYKRLAIIGAVVVVVLLILLKLIGGGGGAVKPPVRRR